MAEAGGSSFAAAVDDGCGSCGVGGVVILFAVGWAGAGCVLSAGEECCRWIPVGCGPVEEAAWGGGDGGLVAGDEFVDGEPVSGYGCGDAGSVWVAGDAGG